jgi:hypothetical protein
MAPRTLFFSLKDLAERWHRTVDDLLQWGMTGDLAISVFLEKILVVPFDMNLWIEQESASCISHLYAKLDKDQLEKLFHSKSETIELKTFSLYNDEDEDDAVIVKWNSRRGIYVVDPITFSRDDFLVSTSEVTRIVAKHPDLSNGVEAPVNDTMLANLLDENHNWYSRELAIAVKAWLELYADHEGHRGSNDYKPFGGHPEQIAEWLEKNYGKVTTPDARGRIAAVVNPCAIPGAGKCKKWHDLQK